MQHMPCLVTGQAQPCLGAYTDVHSVPPSMGQTLEAMPPGPRLLGTACFGQIAPRYGFKLFAFFQSFVLLAAAAGGWCDCAPTHCGL